jgi:hypothetical protein
MADATYSLSWPRTLFVWEASRVLAAFMPNVEWSRTITQLLREAFEDVDVANTFERETGLGAAPWVPDLVHENARVWFTKLLADETRLRQYVPPVYWAERNGKSPGGDAPGHGYSFAHEFIELVTDLSVHGYLPKVLPASCIHEDEDPRADASRTISRAIHQSVSWPIDPYDADEIAEPLLFSLVEYFNDQAQRPRVAWSHEGCEHYNDYNRESGGAVYRWRMNRLLETHNVPLKLAAIGGEQGRLVRRFSSPLDGLLTEQIAKRIEPEDEVAHAIREYRTRDATVTQRRSALTKLAGELEPRRDKMKDRLTRKDSAYLFEIANTFGLRHRGDEQRLEYDEEFLDWMFWNYLAMIQLMDAVDARAATEPATS